MTDSVLLDAQQIVKHYGSVAALRGASFQARAGEVTALIGDNGAGKSTLIKCLSGAELPSSGRILLDGNEVHLDSPTTARRLGIETVYQGRAVRRRRHQARRSGRRDDRCTHSRGGSVSSPMWHTKGPAAGGERR